MGSDRKGIGGHHSAKSISSEWATPPHVIEALGGAGTFAVDPCAMVDQPWPCARQSFNRLDNGLGRRWTGNVYMNPPYSNVIIRSWLSRLVEHGNGIALIFARTETDNFFEYVWTEATAVLFLRGRLFFHYENGARAEHNSGGPSVLIAYGDQEAERLSNCKLPGYFAYLANGRMIT